MSNSPWIGLSALHSPAVYRWVTGQTLIWGLWINPVYTLAGNMDLCVYVIAGQFLQTVCSNTHPYVCQVRPNLGKHLATGIE